MSAKCTVSAVVRAGAQPVDLRRPRPSPPRPRRRRRRRTPHTPRRTPRHRRRAVPRVGTGRAAARSPSSSPRRAAPRSLHRGLSGPTEAGPGSRPMLSTPENGRSCHIPSAVGHVTIRSYGEFIGPMKRSTTETRVYGCRARPWSRAQHGDPDPPHTGTAGPAETHEVCSRPGPTAPPATRVGATVVDGGRALGVSLPVRLDQPPFGVPRRGARRARRRPARPSVHAAFALNAPSATSGTARSWVNVRSGCLHRRLPGREPRGRTSPGGEGSPRARAQRARP